MLAAEIPKSLSSMKQMSLRQINNDFPDLNINELKSIAEKSILECLNALDNKDVEKIKSEKSKSMAYK